MAKPGVNYHYMRTSAQSEPRRYLSLDGVLAAIKDLNHMQVGRGFITARDEVGKHTSRHPDGRTVQFWAENEQGEIVS
jgi:hypothetical protein